MMKIVFYGWIKGMRPIPFYTMLHEKAGIPLKEALDIRLELVSGKTIELVVPTEEIAKEIVSKSLELGVKAKYEIFFGDGY